MKIRNLMILAFCATQFSIGFAEETKINQENTPATETAKPNEFSENEVTEFLDTKIDQAVDKIIEKTSKDSKDKINTDAIKKAKNQIKNRLKKFKITGMATTWDANLALIYNSQNPTFTMSYKNPDGEIKTKTYESQISSWGLKAQLDIKIDFIFFTNTDFSLYEGKKNIELGLGIDYKCPFINFTYSKFKTAPGGIIIIGLPVWDILCLIRNSIEYSPNTFLPPFSPKNLSIQSGNGQNLYVTITREKLMEWWISELTQISIVTGGSLKVID